MCGRMSLATRGSPVSGGAGFKEAAGEFACFSPSLRTDETREETCVSGAVFSFPIGVVPRVQPVLQQTRNEGRRFAGFSERDRVAEVERIGRKKKAAQTPHFGLVGLTFAIAQVRTDYFGPVTDDDRGIIML